MDFQKLIKTRFSCRYFSDKKVTDKQIKEIVKAANLAPSAGNLQAYKIIVVKKQELKDQLALAALSQKFIAQAPIVLVFCAIPEESAKRYDQRGKELYAIQDATIACAYAQLTVTDLGLNTVWVGAFDEEKVAKVLNLSPELKPIAILPIGYGAKQLEPKQRKKLKEILF